MTRVKGKFLGIAPGGTFSGFEKSFFRALEMQGWLYKPLVVEVPFFKVLCVLYGFNFKKSIWGWKRDYLYNASIRAFRKKSKFAKSGVTKKSDQIDFIYQIGALWNPIPDKFSKPFILTVDYTPKLSERRKSEWKRMPGKESSFWEKEVKELFGKANIICAVTKNAKNSIIDDYGIPESKVKVVGPGISASHYDASPDQFPDYDSKRILFIGKGFKGKGLDTLLEAFKRVRLEIPDAVLTIAGPSVEIGGEGVEYLGRIREPEKVKDLYYRSCVFAMPSIFEPVGQVFLEAMSCHLPCIGTTLDAMPELIEDGVTGYTIQPGNSKDLADKLIYLILHPEVADKMGSAGYEKYQKEFVWGVVGRKLDMAIESII